MTPPSSRTPARTGSCSSALSQPGHASEGHLHPSSTSALDKKRRFFLSLFTEVVHFVAQTSYYVAPDSDSHLEGGGAEQ